MNDNHSQASRALAAGTALPHNYIIERVIGEGGFGITYACIHEHTNERVAIKEYFPSNIAYRLTENDAQTIIPFDGQQELFERERRHFLTEASILLEFQHLKHIVGITDIFEENGTIYLVMEFVDGITLKKYIQDNEPMPFDELSSLITPVMRDLIQVHKQGLLHRDISPDNLILGTDNQLHLIDFGSADFESDGNAEMKTVILKSGFAPPEQYLSNGKLGPWTDVYGLCATIYFALTGFAPTESIGRLQKDELPSLSDHAQIRSWQATVIEKGLILQADKRYQTTDALYQAMIIPPIEVSSQRMHNDNFVGVNDKTVIPSNYPYAPINEKKKSKNGFSIKMERHKWYYAVGGLVFTMIILFIVFAKMGILPTVTNSKTTTQQASITTTGEKKTTEITTEATTQNDLCIMIDVVGKSLADAKKELFALDPSIQVETKYISDSSKEAGIVLQQSIASKTTFTRGNLENILLTINKKEEGTTQATTQASVPKQEAASPATNEAATQPPEKKKDTSSSKSNDTPSNDDIDAMFFDE